MSQREIAVIGDRFMLPGAFVEALRPALGAADDWRIRTLELGWPDEPMHHGYAAADGKPLAPGLENLREYMGEPDAIADGHGERAADA